MELYLRYYEDKEFFNRIFYVNAYEYTLNSYLIDGFT